MKILWALLGVVCAANIAVATDSIDEPKYRFDIKIGISAEELHANGEPDHITELPNAVIEEYAIHNGTADLLIIDGKVVQVDYHKGGTMDLPFTKDEIQKVKKVNQMDSEWETVNDHVWALENHKAFLLYGKFTDSSEHVLVAITPKAVSYWENLPEDDKTLLPTPEPKTSPKKTPNPTDDTYSI